MVCQLLQIELPGGLHADFVDNPKKPAIELWGRFVGFTTTLSGDVVQFVKQAVGRSAGIVVILEEVGAQQKVIHPFRHPG